MERQHRRRGEEGGEERLWDEQRRLGQKRQTGGDEEGLSQGGDRPEDFLLCYVE